VDLSELRRRDEGSPVPSIRLKRLGVDPLGGLGVALHFEILRQLLLTDDPAFGQEHFNLAQDEGVAFDRRRVVRLFEPDVPPDAFGLRRTGQTSELGTQLLDGIVETDVDLRSRRTAGCGTHLRAEFVVFISK
jgi:hypothetical protein